MLESYLHPVSRWGYTRSNMIRCHFPAWHRPSSSTVLFCLGGWQIEPPTPQSSMLLITFALRGMHVPTSPILADIQTAGFFPLYYQSHVLQRKGWSASLFVVCTSSGGPHGGGDRWRWIAYRCPIAAQISLAGCRVSIYDLAGGFTQYFAHNLWHADSIHKATKKNIWPSVISSFGKWISGTSLTGCMESRHHPIYLL